MCLCMGVCVYMCAMYMHLQNLHCTRTTTSTSVCFGMKMKSVGGKSENSNNMYNLRSVI